VAEFCTDTIRHICNLGSFAISWICGIEGEIQFPFLMTPYPSYKIQFNKKRGAQTDQNSVSLLFYAFLLSDYSDGYVQLHCL